jgi:hypothetical protein
MPPWRIQHESHTCSEQSLRILMWNASYVQKHSKYTWQEKVEDQIREGSRRMYFKATARCNISIWAKSLPPWHQVWIENSLKKRRAGSGLGRMPSSKIIKWDCQDDLASYVHDIHAKICRYRWMIRSPFPHHTIASLRQVGMMGLTPLPLETGNWKIWSFTSVQMVHTHTPSSPQRARQSPQDMNRRVWDLCLVKTNEPCYTPG